MEHTIELVVSEEEFEHTIGRKPRNKEEFEDWGRLIEKGLSEHIDWDILFECARDEIPES